MYSCEKIQFDVIFKTIWVKLVSYFFKKYISKYWNIIQFQEQSSVSNKVSLLYVVNENYYFLIENLKK